MSHSLIEHYKNRRLRAFALNFCPAADGLVFSMANPTDYICFSFKEIKKREYRAPTSLCTSRGSDGTRRVSDQIEELNRIRAEALAASKTKNPDGETKDAFVKYCQRAPRCYVCKTFFVVFTVLSVKQADCFRLG